MILVFGLPTAFTSSVPTTGENKTGVSRATPISPYFFQNFTKRRFRLVKILRFLTKREFIHSLNLLPSKVKLITVVIIPKMVNSAVSKAVKPKAGPIAGPAKNFTLLAK